ncbi:hypothetical protein MGYG_06544 [Nannizzia gypsea CBS 118893]|uniref:C2H2-type domain-containing protein n=1 Tax=Arthroderma gypseum (strain ATCC MYA-4604 / CBS 118893) TaxID=535722 RepID=E4UZL8_ARTGP|nr:hypothetical protein MGYG_06544 [Nannizzia gypsea CBS 118893]EFR03548.1 hypothetical protein MGYG_06544 [Nannizzia gypsea CBS 118893]
MEQPQSQQNPEQKHQEQKPAKFRCQFAGCNRSYLRSEHLNRHALIHKKGAFLCYLCQRRFTRNDLLNAHLRRHEKRKSTSEGVEQPPNASDASAAAAAAAASAGQPAALASLSPPPSTTLAIVASSSPSETRPSPATAEWHLEPQNRLDGAVGQSPAAYSEVGRSPVAHFPAMAPLTLPSPSPRTDPSSHIYSNSHNNNHSHSHLPPSGQPAGMHQHHQHHHNHSHAPPHSSMPPVGHLPHLLSHQQQSHQQYLAMPTPFDGYPWLFHSTSLFDLPSDDYLNLHFGDTTDHTSPPVCCL